MADLSKNDRRVLDGVREVVEDWKLDGYMPHGSADWTAIHRLMDADLVEYVDMAQCCECPNGKEHEGPSYRLTDAGRAEMSRG